MTVRKAMTFKSAEATEIDGLINDDNIALEQKYDGTRAMVVIKRGESVSVEFLARNGGPLKHTAAMQWFTPIAKALADMMVKDEILGEIVLDGEIMIDTGNFFVFDLPYVEVQGKVTALPTDEYRLRRRHLALLLAPIDGLGPVHVAKTHWDPINKRALFDSVVASNGEGVMAKALDASYEEGKRVRHSQKIKFVKTADVVVISVRRERNEEGREIGSIEYGVYYPVLDENNEVEMVLKPLGKCSPIGKPHCVAGDVIEVRYLYRQAGGALVQPTMLQVREDREPESCTLDQFTDYSKAVV